MNKSLKSLLGMFLLLAVFGGSVAVAAVKPNVLFSDGAVLQRGQRVPIWGIANDGEKVTVQFQNQKASTVAKDGKWRVTLKPLEAGGPFPMTISGDNTVEIKNILVGEVWVCSGQSNMEMQVATSANAREVTAGSKDSMLHLWTVPHTQANEPAREVQGNWSECGPDTVGQFSAVGYFFGRDLRKALDVPIGLIHTSFGGTTAEAWTSRRTLAADPRLRSFLEQPPVKGNSRPCALYNGMIAPLIPYAIRGAIWYQGESNAPRAYEYRTLFPAMIRNWREDWRQGDFPFLFVQLAPFTKIVAEPGDSTWAELREAQLLTSLKVPRTAMAVITDVGEETDIHPKRKEPVGARLALAARAVAYHERIIYSGPIFHSMKIQGDRAILSFQHVGSGLVAQGGELKGFAIAGEDKTFVNAYAEIDGDRVVVSSPQVSHPVAVRYGWANYPVVNLYNKEGLPASPFRTDDFPMVTKPH